MDRHKLRPILRSVLDLMTRVGRRRMFASRASSLRRAWARQRSETDAVVPIAASIAPEPSPISQTAYTAYRGAVPAPAAKPILPEDTCSIYGLTAMTSCRIPAPPPDFVGRARELEELQANFAQGVCIAGAGAGIGVTALARRLAHQLAHRFPDGCIEIGLRGATAGGDETEVPVEIQRMVLKTLEPTRSLPEDAGALGKLYRRTLSEKAVLLLFDDAAGAPQLRHLLPRKTSAAIVTSQVAMPVGWEKLYPLALSGLSPEDARSLLSKLMPAKLRVPRRVADRMLARLRYNPLAIRILIPNLNQGVGAFGKLERALTESWRRTEALKGRQAANLEVDVVLDLACERLPEELRLRFAALAVFMGPFLLPGAAAVWQSSPQEAEPWLAALARANLVDYRPEARSYMLHSWVRRHAEELLLSQPELAQIALVRYVDHVLQLAKELAERCRRQEELSSHEGLTYGELVLHLRAAWIWLTHSEPGWPQIEGVDQRIRDLLLHTMPALRVLLSGRELVLWLARGCEAARRLEDRRAEAVFLGLQGHLRYAAGNPAEAASLYELQLRIVRERDDRRAVAGVLVSLGRACFASHDPETAWQHWTEALTLLESSGDPHAERVRALLALGRTATPAHGLH